MKKVVTTTIEITDSHVKFFQSRIMRGKRIVSSCDIKSLHEFTDEEIVANLKSIVAHKNIQADELTFIIPRRFVILKYMRLPSHNEMEIQKMVGLQLVNQIPYSLEDSIYNYFILDKDSFGYARLLVVVIHKEINERYLNIFNKAGITLDKFTLSSFGLLGWLVYQETEKKMEIKQPVVLINIDLQHTEICFCQKKNLLFSRSINYGARDLNEEGIPQMVNQVELSLSAYKKEKMGPEIESILILSILKDASRLKEALGEKNNVTVKVLTSLENVLCQKNIDLTGLADKLYISLTVGIGALFSNTKRLINITPQEIYDVNRIKIKKRQWIKFIIFFLLTCGLGLSIWGIELFQKANYLYKLEEQIEQIKPDVETAKNRIQLVRFLDEEFKGRLFISDIAYELTNLAPKEISFHSLSIDARGYFVLQGYAQTSASVYNFQEKLMKSSMFHNVNLQSATKRKIFNKELTNFKITFWLKERGEDK